MSEDKPPNPLTDLRKGLGLLFRAAATTARKLPTTNLGKEFEEAVVTSVREVGRAIENVATTIEREVRGRTGSSGDATRPDANGANGAKSPHGANGEESAKGDSEETKPRDGM